MTKMLRSLITLYTDYSKVSNKKSISINGVFDSGTLSFYVDSKDVIDGLQNHFIASNDSIHTGKKIGRRPGIYKSNYSVFSMPEYTLIRAGKKVESVFEALQFIRANYFGYVNNLEDQSSCVISRDEQKHSDESVLTSAIMPQVLK